MCSIGCTGIGHAPICSSSWRLPCDSAIARGPARRVPAWPHRSARSATAWCAAAAPPAPGRPGPPPTMAMSNGSGLGAGLWLGLGVVLGGSRGLSSGASSPDWAVSAAFAALAAARFHSTASVRDLPAAASRSALSSFCWWKPGRAWRCATSASPLAASSGATQPCLLSASPARISQAAPVHGARSETRTITRSSASQASSSRWPSGRCTTRRSSCRLITNGSPGTTCRAAAGLLECVMLRRHR